MEGFGQWVITVSVCAVIVSITEILLADSPLLKHARFVMGAFMLCAVLIPLGGVAAGIPEVFDHGSLQPDADTPEKLGTLREEYIKGRLESLVTETLVSGGVRPQRVRVGMDIDDTGCINMITAQVDLPAKQADRSSEVSRLIKEDLGIECRTRVVG